MKRAILTAALALLALAPSARADFGLSGFDVVFTNQDGSPAMQAGSHPFAMTTSFDVNTVQEGGGTYVDGAIRNLDVFQAAGFVGTPTPGPRCATADFLSKTFLVGTKPFANCPDSSAVGIVENLLGTQGTVEALPPIAVYNLEPPPGIAARLGFWVADVPVMIQLRVSASPPYEVLASLVETSQAVEVHASKFTLWGNPADPAHDSLRGHCLGGSGPTGASCPADVSIKPFFTLPRRCQGPLETRYQALSWWTGSPLAPGPPAADSGSAFTHDGSTPPGPLGTGGCGKLSFGPEISAVPTSRAAQSPSGLDFALRVHDQGLTNPAGIAHADIARAEVFLPEGFTANPAIAEGLEVCTEAQLDRESAFSEPGDGCPGAAKIGTVEVETPLLTESIEGSLYVAEPYANPFDSLLALYIVLKNPTLGISITQPLEVRPDPATGRLTTLASDLPELPFSSFRLKLREGARSPLVSPPGCDGDPSRPGRQPHEVEAILTPSSGAPPIATSSAFEIVSGPNGSPCPSGPAPFDPGFEAGTLNNAAGAYSPFYMRLSREDGMQDLSRFSAVLPPGVLGRLAGIPWCPEAGIAQARGRTGEHGGSAELADPSCPAASLVGRTVAGAGVGSQLTYVPGSLYLAGPFAGAPLSVVSITPAIAGPFDAGAVVVRVGLRLNPHTAVVEADGAASDPIPHILQGIPLNVRDLRVYADRPAFTLNATSCEPSHALATLWGAGTVLDPRPETPLGRAARYQAAGCASLEFEPKLAIKLRGGVKRGAHPALRAHVVPRAGDANFSRAVVTLPRSAFLDQAHIRTICTRVQFAAGAGHGSACPPGAQYGFARAWSPLLDAPLSGPVYLRSSDNNLPDLVVALKGPPQAAIEIELSARIDSVKGGIRSTFTGIPDAPVSRFILDMQGGKKGLIVNSRNLCHKPKRNRAKANLRGQNGRFSKTRPRVVAAKCQKRRGAKRKRARRSTGHSARASRAG